MRVVTHDGHSLIRTQCFREVEGLITTTLNAKVVACPDGGRAVDLVASRFGFSNTDLWFCAYGTPLTVEFPETDMLRIQLHHKGEGSTRLGANTFSVTPNQAVISTSDATIHFGTDYEQKVLRISKEGLSRKMAAYLGMPLTRPLDFAPVEDCRHPNFGIFQKTLAFVESMAQLPTALPALIATELEQSLYAAILASFQHNYTSSMEKQSTNAASWQVRQAEEYIEAHWNQPITIEEIAAITRCSARSIFRAFQHYRGYSPIAFVKQVRLKHAHRMLLNAEETTVTRTAFACGFSDLGRFSKDYAATFGELPSQTFKRTQLPLLVKNWQL